MCNYQDLTYQYDNGGNITFIGDTLWSGGREFAYDDLNRLTRASGNFGPNLMEVTHNYTYDPIGNVLSKANVLFYYCGHPLQPASSQYCNGPQHPSAVVNTSDGNVYTYDANGSTATGAGRTYTWNVENRLAELSAPGGTVISIYDHTGTRIKKQASGAITYFPFAGYEVTGAVVTKYIRIGIEIVAAKKGGEKFFYHDDHQGGINIITDIFAGIVEVKEYDPWGKVTRSEGNGNTESTKGFNGKELDQESGLYYYGARYYDPNLMRFVSPDPFIQEPGNPQNFNRYSYTINNPQKYVDPSGHFFGLIFALVFRQAIASKLTAGSDPFTFLLSKIPKKVNAGIQIFGGVAMMLTGNPAGAFYVASGAMSFGKGSGFQIASQVLGAAGAAASFGQLGGDTGGQLSSFAGIGGCTPGDDFCGARPTVITFPIPIGTGSATGEFFIKAKRAGPFRGDDRNFDPAANPNRSRAYFNLDFDKGVGTFQINPTCLAVVEICRSALPIGQGNTINTTVSGNTVTLSGELRNSFLGGVPEALDVNISFKISVTTTPAGITAKGVIDPFPSFEFTTTVGGITQVGPRLSEHPLGAVCLTGVCGRATFRYP